MSASRIPILKLGPYLIASVQVELHDRLALAFTDELAQKVVDHGARGVLVDISTVDVVDTFMGRVLRDLAATLRVLDAETVVVGMQPAVAITLVELGLSLEGVRTALDVEEGMALLQRHVDADGRGPLPLG
jgi:rsbT antagonist protein RsbS